MDYYDGNTVTALWNYAQHWAMSDNSYNTTFGPSTPGMLNLVAGQTHGATPAVIAGSTDNGTVYGDPDGAYDDCSGSTQVSMSGTNVGDLLNSAGVTWGWFQGGFRPSAVVSGKAQCKTSHTNIGGATVTDYSAHHEPFQYYASTANPHHTRPASVAEIGHSGPANHQYDLSDFYSALNANNLPAVSFLKAAKYQDGHAGYSDPLDEQTFVVNAVNALQQSGSWKNTAVVIAYDDSDGWYDHVMPPIVNSSASAEDALTSTGKCGNGTPLGGYQDRCGYGPRLPLLVLSPYARQNYVDHAITDQSSILRFIEDNWSLPRIGGGSFDAIAGSINGMFDFQNPSDVRLILDPSTGLKD
jgi:phospholipase C